MSPEDFEKWLENNPRYREKRADSWLQRWLALHASRDAANMQHPTGDAIASKLGGPFSLGLGEAVGNALTLGRTRQQRHRNLERAVRNIEEKSYGEAASDGLKSSLPYAAVGAIGGAAHAALDKGLSLRDLIHGGAIGAGLGISAAVTRPLAQKAILDAVSRRAKRKAIAIKADSPISTSLPFGDIVAAAAHKEASLRFPVCPSALLCRVSAG